MARRGRIDPECGPPGGGDADAAGRSVWTTPDVMARVSHRRAEGARGGRRRRVGCVGRRPSRLGRRLNFTPGARLAGSLQPRARAAGLRVTVTGEVRVMVWSPVAWATSV